MIGPNSPRAKELTRLLQVYAYGQADEATDYVYLFNAAVNLTAAVYLTCYKNTEGDAPGAEAARAALRNLGELNSEKLHQLIRSANPLILAEAMGCVTRMETVAVKNGQVVRNPEPTT